EHVLRGSRVVRLDELPAEEGVGGGDTAAGGLLAEGAADVCGELRPVSLRRQQAEVVVAAVPFVDQVLLVDALGLVWRGVRDVIADGGQGQRQRGQSLL